MNIKEVVKDDRLERVMPTLMLVQKAAESLGVRAFVIGGYVRDLLLGRPSADVDIVVEGSGVALAEEVGRLNHNAKVVVFKRFGTAMLHSRGIEVEFVGARKESYRADSRKPIVEDGTLRDDQLRRDFTINALSFSLQKADFGEIYDPFGGVEDLHKGIIRTPLDPDTTYSDDPLRMIRGIRFATQLGFEIVPESMESMKRNRGRMAILSVERITEELNKIMASPRPSVGIELLDRATLLELILPQVAAMKGVEEQEGRRHKDNFRHTMKVLDNVAASSDKLWLRWAALLHDIGKAVTKKYEPGIGWTFYSHNYVGAKMVRKITNFLRLPVDDMKYVQKLVELHMRPIALVEEEVTDSAVRRLLFDAGDDIDDLMILCGADITSKNEATVARHKHNFELVKEKLVEVEEKDRVRNFQPPVNGDMIMEIYGIPPCNLIGEIKEYIKNAILDGVIPNENDAALKLMRDKATELGLKEVSKQI